ncbi:MAG: Trk system potassium transporter TrkA [Candidatus Zixiibacteriota bacterium]|nr:MAG: Trk system potassium transporter TrkA [candidate division Zixibacteria bacterium]
MRIVIVGGGIVGYSLAEYLLGEKHRLCLVEVDSHLCQSISEKLDLQVINGSGSSPAVMKAAGIADADMLLAVTPINEVNIVACSIALQHNVSQRIARLRGEEYAGASGLIDLDKIGITSVIHPEKVLVDQVLQYVETPHSIQSANFEGGKMLMRGYHVTDQMPLAGKTPREIRQQIAPDTVLFSALVRNGVGMIPDGDTLIQPRDTVYSLFPRESLERFMNLVGHEKKPSRKIIITGDSYSTLVLAQVLEERDEYQVTFVDPDLSHAEQAAALVGNIEVLHGDGTDDDLLRELNVDRASFFIAVSDSPDYNMLSALLAKAEGAHEVIATTTDMRHNKLYNSIGIDHVINPRLTTAREILEIISRGHIGAVVRLSDVDIQAIRFNVDPTSDMAGAKIRKVATKLKKGSIIGVVIRQDRMILPHGETVIEAGDHVIVITHRRNIPTLSKLFKPRGLFKRS